jgi:hypothetical protein
MRRDERVELPGHFGVAACGEVGVDRFLRGPDAQFLEAADLGRGERFVDDVSQRVTAPQRKRLARARLLEQALEANRVDIILGNLQLIAAPASHDPSGVAPEQRSQVRDVELHHLRRTRRRLLSPQALDQVVHRHRTAGVERQHCEDGPLLAGAQLHGPIPEANLERP